MQVFPSPCELQLFKPRQPQLASWICSVRAVAFAFEFQASDGSEEQAFKRPFEAAVRIKAGWLLNGIPNLSHYSGKVDTKALVHLFSRLLWEVSHTRWHIVAWMRFNRRLQHKMSSPGKLRFCKCSKQFAMVRSVQRIPKGNFNVLWFALFCFHLFWWQYCQIFKRQCPGLCVFCFVAHFAPGPGRRVAPQSDHHRAQPARPKYLWWAAEGSAGVGRGRPSLAEDLGVWQSKRQTCGTASDNTGSSAQLQRNAHESAVHLAFASRQLCRPSPARFASTKP